jgi:hypothetical protein
MKTYIKNILVVSMSMAFFNCSEIGNQVETSANEMLKIQGVAATGYALTEADVELFNEDGDLVYKGKTSEKGEYLAEIKGENAEKVLRIRVEKGLEKLETFVKAPRVSERVFAHVNPITEMLFQITMESGWENFELNLEKADQMLKKLLGSEFDYASFSSNVDFVAAVEGNLEIIPSIEDMMIHAIGEKARESAMERKNWIHEQIANQAQLMGENAEFRARFIKLSAEYGVDPEEIRAKVGEKAYELRNQYLNQLDSLKMNLCGADFDFGPILEERLTLELSEESTELNLEEVQLEIIEMALRFKNQCGLNMGPKPEVPVREDVKEQVLLESI